MPPAPDDAARPAPLVVAVVGPSGVGKTTLLEGVVAALTGRGLRVAAVKHSGHPHPLQPPGSDSARLHAAGAAEVGFVTPEGWTRTRRGPPAAADLPRLFAGCDLVLVEGWRASGLPALRVSRAARPDPAWAPPEGVVAWVTDHPTPPPLPRLPLEAAAVADALARWRATGQPPYSSSSPR